MPPTTRTKHIGCQNFRLGAETECTQHLTPRTNPTDQIKTPARPELPAMTTDAALHTPAEDCKIPTNASFQSRYVSSPIPNRIQHAVPVHIVLERAPISADSGPSQIRFGRLGRDICGLRDAVAVRGTRGVSPVIQLRQVHRARVPIVQIQAAPVPRPGVDPKAQVHRGAPEPQVPGAPRKV